MRLAKASVDAGYIGTRFVLVSGCMGDPAVQRYLEVTAPPNYMLWGVKRLSAGLEILVAVPNVPFEPFTVVASAKGLFY